MLRGLGGPVCAHGVRARSAFMMAPEFDGGPGAALPCAALTRAAICAVVADDISEPCGGVTPTGINDREVRARAPSARLPHRVIHHRIRHVAHHVIHHVTLGRGCRTRRSWSARWAS